MSRSKNTYLLFSPFAIRFVFASERQQVQSHNFYYFSDNTLNTKKKQKIPQLKCLSIYDTHCVMEYLAERSRQKTRC